MDEVITALPFRDFIVVITKRGYVYRLLWDDLKWGFQFSLICRLEL